MAELQCINDGLKSTDSDFSQHELKGCRLITSFMQHWKDVINWMVFKVFNGVERIT